MKRILIILLISLISCQEDSLQISDQVSLKNLPENFFKENISYTIHSKQKDYKYTNIFKRLPNTEFSKFYLKKHSNTYLPYFNVTINLNKDSKTTLEGVHVLKEELISYTREFIDFSAENQLAMVHLNFDEEVLLKDYIDFLSFIQPLVSDTITLNSNVFIYNTKLLPDCDCSL